MSAPPPDPNDLAARLFAAARSERPTAEARERMMQLAASSRAASGQAPIIPLDELAGASGMRRASRPSRTIAIALTSVACAAAALALLAREAAPPAVIAPSHDDALPRRERAAPAWPRTEAAPRTAVSPASAGARAPKTVPHTPSKAERHPELPPASPSLASEISALNDARSALGANDGQRALQLLDAYERTLRGTQLRAEATVLRIEALLSVGNRTKAADLAERFVTDNPDSPLADRARELAKPPPAQGELP